MRRHLLLVLFLSAFLLGFTGVVFASTTDGTVSGYAWSDQIGWVNFGTTNGNVRVTSSAITGYAWNENTGRIFLNPTESGVANNGQGVLSGSAWAEGTGWIDFSGVSIDSSGVFSGTATGDNGVNIYFSCGTKCSVTTDWRATGAASTGGGGGGGNIVHKDPRPPFSILINNASLYTNRNTVELFFEGGPDAVKMAISNSPDFYNISQEDYPSAKANRTKAWQLAGADGKKTVYVKFYTEDGIQSPVVSADIVLDTISPEIKIASIKDKYGSNEDVLISGTASESNLDVVMTIDSNYGIFQTKEGTDWFITLGKLSEGSHQIEFTPKDRAGNAGSVVSASFLVEKSEATPVPPLDSILKKIEEGLTPLIPNFFKPGEKLLPEPVVIVPKTAQLAFKVKWRLLPEKPIARFVLAPLPQDVKLLAQAFPQVEKTFSEVGITKITDVEKIKNANLSLPGLTETVGLAPANVAVGKFAMIKGVPVAQLSSVAKSKIPSNIVFSKAGGGLVDFNVALSVNNQGKTEQRITTLVNNPLQLVVKPDAPVKRVRGYIVFKSKKPSDKPSLNVPLNKLASSYAFSDPNIVFPAGLSASIPLEGAEAVKNEIIIEGAKIEERLVLAEFDYIDSGNGVYTATVQAPMVDGEYEIITVMDYTDDKAQSKEIKLITVVDPEGYVYEKSGNRETRIAGAIVSLFWLNPETKQYELWPAKNYQQEDPQTTDIRGTYSFLVPEGYYYLKVDAPGYISYDGKPFEVKEGSGVHVNIELKTRFWFLNLIDWKTCLLIIVVLMLLYNFYKDRIRERKAVAI